MERERHWEQVYTNKAPDAVSWYQERPELSLALIARAHPGVDARVIDVGGGASRLVDHLLERGYRNVTVLDVSAEALRLARSRLGARAEAADWIVADVTTASLPAAAFDVWHDRAVFHFLTSADDRTRYVERAARALAPGGALVIATFADDGPTRCSGLDVVRYSPETLAAEFASAFALVESERETHWTPGGAEQRFIYCLFRRDARAKTAAPRSAARR